MKSGRLSIRVALLTLFPIFTAQSAQPPMTLVVAGHTGDAKLVSMKGKS